MDWLQALVLAALQGFTEFLPISSSGHLVLPAALFGWPDQGLAFDVAVHVGSLTAVLLYFRRDVRQLILAWLQSLRGQGSTESRLAWMLIIATVPACIAGLALNDLVETELRHLGVLAATTIGFGLLLGWADRFHRHRLELENIRWREALIIGLFQALALIPGTSRSGITITAGLMLGLKREAAARFSFLMSIPIIVAAGSLKTVELAQSERATDWSLLVLGTAVAGVTAYLCIRWFLALVERIGMMPFVIYRLVLGALLIVVMVRT